MLNKLVKKNYNNELETILESKPFEENAKNILLSMMYKLENAYSDYETVKANVMPKDEFLQKIIEVIKNDVDSIRIVKMKSKEAQILEGKQYKIDKENKEIICYPIERVVLYCLSEISKKDKIVKEKYYMIDRTFSDLLLIGNDINTVEPIRDFNGFSWDIVTKDIESLECNIVYQNLRILVGAKFLNKWIYNKEIMLDYYDLFKNKLEELYGKEIQEEVLKHILSISVLLEQKNNSEVTEKFEKDKIEIDAQLKKLNEKEQFIQDLTKKKKDINKKIKNIDKIINNKALLQQEYIVRNEKLPLEKKIFSMKVLSKILGEERIELEEKRKEINKKLNPKQYVKMKSELEEKSKRLSYIGTADVDKDIKDELITIQEIFIKCFKKKIENAKTKKDIFNLFVELRYYLNLPISKTKKINSLKQFSKEIDEIINLLLDKALKAKVIVNILNNSELNDLVLKEIINTKIINLQSICINFAKEEDKLVLNIYDENVFDKKVELCDLNMFKLSDFSVRINKNVKLFIV